MNKRISNRVTGDFGFVYKGKLIHGVKHSPDVKGGCDMCYKTGLACPLSSINSNAIEGLKTPFGYSCSVSFFKTFE